jgi:hypothetical protein
MKKLILAVIGLLAIQLPAIAQTTQNRTALIYRPSIAVLNGRGSGTAITNGTATTQTTLDNTTFIASDAFVNGEIVRSKSTIPLSITGGTYNFASLGSGLTVVPSASGGAITGFLTIATAGTGYAVGDVLSVQAGNRDAFIRINTIGAGGSVPSTSDLTILYGGTGYTTGGSPSPLNISLVAGNTFTLTGTLTSNVFFILQTGTFITSSNQLVINNNTTGAFVMQFFASDGAGGTKGVGVTIPQGTANSCATILEKDGVNDVWLAAPSVCQVAPNYFTAVSSSIGGTLLTAGSCSSGTVSIPNSTNAMGVVVTPATFPGVGIWWEGYVSISGTVTIQVCASVAATPTATAYNVRVLQ